MKKVVIAIQHRARSVRFDVPDTTIFRNGGFDLHYSFDIEPSERGLLSMAVGLLAPIIARKFPGEVEIVLPQTIPHADALAWRQYHKLPPRIHLRTAADTNVPAPPAPSADSAVGLLYGGGKDSVAALTLAEELYPSSPKHLLRLHWSAQSPERHKAAFENFALPRLREHVEFDYFSVASTMHAELVDRTDAASIHLARYLCSFIPYVEKLRPRYLCHGYDALEFHGSAYRRAHPQVLRYIDGVYRRMGVPTTIRSLCFALPPKLNFGIVAKLRPELVPAMYMCESLDTRWCYRCRKCFTYGILCLAHGIEAEGFDLLRMFDPANPYMVRVAGELADLAPGAPNQQLLDLVAYPAHVQATSGWGHEVANGARKMALPAGSISTLDRLFSTLQPIALPHMDKLWLQAAAYEGGPQFADALRAIADSHGFELLESAPVTGHVKGAEVSYLVSDIE